MSKALFLLLDSNNHGEILKSKIEDGCTILKGKQFIVDVSSPILLKRGMGIKPLYILKWSATQPSTNIHSPRTDSTGTVQYVDDTKFRGERIKTRFEDRYELTPEMLRKIMGMKILGNMIKIKKPSMLGGWGMVLIGGLAIFMIIYGLIYLGYIKL
jgi:hypothetical protein